MKNSLKKNTLSEKEKYEIRESLKDADFLMEKSYKIIRDLEKRYGMNYEELIKIKKAPEGA